MKKLINFMVIGLCILLVGGCFMSIGTLMAPFAEHEASIEQDSIMVLDLEGIITDGKSFLKLLRKHAKNKNIKAIVIRVNSPGGVVGGSQEIYTELKRIRNELNKPIVAACNSVAASGAYYIAVAADRILTNPGTMMGSIGVIMQFANLERLYDWAKMRRYVIKTGPYKDSGSDHRPMRDDERALFQGMINQVHDQFKLAVANGRKLSVDVVEKYADGRIFTGETAVNAGFADQLGTFEDAVKVAAELAGIGDDPQLFFPKTRREMWQEILGEALTPVRGTSMSGHLETVIDKVMHLRLSGQPLYLMPGAYGF